MTDRRRVVLLGATGSIGTQACDVIAQHPDRFELVGAVALANATALRDIQSRFDVKKVATSTPNDEGLPSGGDAVLDVAGMDCDVVCVAIPGTAALEPTLVAIGLGRDIALASKEVLVAAGDLIRERCVQQGATLFPVDSEHSAIWQCLRGEDVSAIKRLIITASGGPFRAWDTTQMRNATREQALAHPNWNMGPKVTIDSATMMNKGLEVIEAHHLFALPYERIDVVIHPTSSIHSMVEFVDGVTMAQIGIPDMHPPIALALSGGERLHGVAEPLDMSAPRTLTFEAVDAEKFPAVALAKRCGDRGGLLPAAMNAANEQAVAEFLAGAIRFTEIIELVAGVVEELPEQTDLSLATIQATDSWARDRVRHIAAGARA